MPPARILVIDDEPQIRRFLDISLRAVGYQAILASTGYEGLSLLEREGADLVILDIGLPDMDGHEVLRALRKRSHVPVMMLSVRAGEAEKVAALDAGANDYVTKPFGTQEFMARVRAMLRQRGGPAGSSPRFDDGYLQVDFRTREVTLAGEPLSLARKEFALLSMLIRHRDQVVTQPQILREVWGTAHQGDAHYVRVLVAKLRHKLKETPAEPRYILTEPGVGLRFVSRS